MKENIFTRMELLFWNFAIRALCDFRVVRSSLARNEPLSVSAETAFPGILIGIAGVAGLVSGYLFYFLTVSLR
jgi:hypothetical protein